MTLNLNIKNNIADDYFYSTDAVFEDDAKQERILIVDDEELVRRFHCDCLSPRYKCFEAASSEEALEILKEEKIALVITDWVMSGMSGKMLLRHIVRELPDTFVIMISGIDHRERSLDALRVGAFDYLLKPSAPEMIELTVERALEHRDVKIKARQYKIDLELQSVELNKRKAAIELLQERLKHAENSNLLESPTAELAHKFNNPLSYISGNLQILESYFQDIRELVALYDENEVTGKNSPAVEEFKKKIHFAGLFENIDAVIADCGEGTERVSRLVRSMGGSAEQEQPVEFDKTDNDEYERRSIYEKENFDR